MLKCDCCSVNWAKWVVKKAKRDQDRGDVDTYPMGTEMGPIGCDRVTANDQPLTSYNR